MNQAFRNQAPPPYDPGDGGSFVDWQVVRNWCVFAWRAMGRRKALIFGVFSLVVALAAFALVVLPKRYHVETRLLAQKNQVLALPGEETGGKAPSSAAQETVLRRDNLVALVKETNLLQEMSARRAPAARFKDWAVSPFMRDLTEAERVDGVVKYLKKQLVVKNDDTTGQVSIEVTWPDALIGYRIVDAAQRAFLEAKHVEETTAIAEHTSILEGHAAQLRREIDTSVREIQAIRAKKAGEKLAPLAPPPPPTHAPATPAAPAAPVPAAPVAKAPKLDDESVRRMAELGVMIETKRNAIRELDEFRQRRVAELTSQVEDKRGSYTEAHPAMVDLRQSLAAAQRESPQVKNLRLELGRLEAEHGHLASLAAAAGEPVPRPSMGRAGGGSTRGAANDEVIRIEQVPAEERDPEIEYARAKLKYSITSYQELEQQIQRARIALDTAEAAFKFRYTMVTPPEVPKNPMSPNALVVILGAVFGGLFLGLLAAIALELKRGVLQDAWQVEQFLALPVLATVRARAELSRP